MLWLHRCVVAALSPLLMLTSTDTTTARSSRNTASGLCGLASCTGTGWHVGQCMHMLLTATVGYIAGQADNQRIVRCWHCCLHLACACMPTSAMHCFKLSCCRLCCFNGDSVMHSPVWQTLLHRSSCHARYSCLGVRIREQVVVNCVVHLCWQAW